MMLFDRTILAVGLARMTKNLLDFHGEEDPKGKLLGFYCGVNHTFVHYLMAKR